MNWLRWNVPLFLLVAKVEGLNHSPQQHPPQCEGCRKSGGTTRQADIACTETETCQNNPKKAFICHYSSAGFETLCIAKAAVNSHLNQHDQDHCGECNDNDYCGEPPVGYIECNRDTGTWSVGKVWNWTQTTPIKLTASDAADEDRLGESVGISGNQVFAGSIWDDGRSGSVYVFELNQTSRNWTEKQKLTASDRVDGVVADFGFSLAVSDDILVIGALIDESAYVFEKDPYTGYWNQTAKLKASESDGDHLHNFFGYSVGVYGNAIVVGAATDSDEVQWSGSVYVFERGLSRGNWSQTFKLTASDRSYDDLFGESVAVFENRIVVGSIFGGDYDSGSLYVFEFNTTESVWEEKAKLTASDADSSDGFGNSVAISGDVIVVGARFKGHAYIFEWNTSTSMWDQTANLVDSDFSPDLHSLSQFGHSVDIDKDLVIVGSYYSDGIHTKTGAAFVFAKNETDMTWEEQAKLSPNDGHVYDLFGYKVGISQDIAVVGSPYNDHIDEGEIGAVYVYDRK